MFFGKPTLCCLLLAASAAHCHQSDSDDDEKYHCPRDVVKLERGGKVEIFSPTANVSCTTVDIFLLADNSSLPGVTLTNGDPATAGAPISTAAISQTCSHASNTPSGTCAGIPTASAGTSVTTGVPTDGSTATTLGGVTATGSSTGATTGAPTGPPSAPPTVPATTQEPIPTSTIIGGPEGTRPTSPGGGDVPTMTHSTDPVPFSTNPAQQTTAPRDSATPTNAAGTQGNGSATGPISMGTTANPTSQSAHTCTCHDS
ncbi:hypothetical protein X797_011219 [Metarhizium robertsii]|uniref:Uncharacterized protein n=1 Tax=Metarhizium robertsii TaxID=568076 RepID=A0A0A1UMW4_9HYPO|nr:hypothetical protein X797_011219 [Metarhizium robertsii]